MKDLSLRFLFHGETIGWRDYKIAWFVLARHGCYIATSHSMVADKQWDKQQEKRNLTFYTHINVIQDLNKHLHFTDFKPFSMSFSLFCVYFCMLVDEFYMPISFTILNFQKCFMTTAPGVIKGIFLRSHVCFKVFKLSCLYM